MAKRRLRRSPSEERTVAVPKRKARRQVGISRASESPERSVAVRGLVVRKSSARTSPAPGKKR